MALPPVLQRLALPVIGSPMFILSNPQKAIDYAYRAVHVTAETAKNIATDYYGRPITFSYWNSCSNGGRQGLLEAQRYPDDYDTIAVTGMSSYLTRHTFAQMWIWQATHKDAASFIPPDRSFG